MLLFVEYALISFRSHNQYTISTHDQHQDNHDKQEKQPSGISKQEG